MYRVEATGDLVASLVFKTSVGLNKVPGGFDSHSPPFLWALPQTPNMWAAVDDNLPGVWTNVNRPACAYEQQPGASSDEFFLTCSK